MDSRLRTELWTSFASVLRSYAAAHGMNSTHHAVVEVGPQTLTLRVASKWLTVSTDEQGAGELRWDDDRSLPFRLHEDGSVSLGEQREEMDMAAEQLAREMLR